MQIRVSTGDCRAAIAAAIESVRAKIASDRAAFSERSLTNLRAGAEHNGLDVNAARLQEMKDMVERDVEHAMQLHSGNETLLILQNYSDMLNFHTESSIVIDDQDFHLIKPHLPGAKAEAPKEDPALKAKDNYHGDAPAFA